MRGATSASTCAMNLRGVDAVLDGVEVPHRERARHSLALRCPSACASFIDNRDGGRAHRAAAGVPTVVPTSTFLAGAHRRSLRLTR